MNKYVKKITKEIKKIIFLKFNLINSFILIFLNSNKTKIKIRYCKKIIKPTILIEIRKAVAIEKKNRNFFEIIFLSKRFFTNFIIK